jgi:hypothetical protein
MTAAEAISFIKEHGVVLASAKGPVPRLTEAIVNEPIRGSWWAHPKSHDIFAIFQAVTDSKDVLVCRLVDRKVTFVHRRLWPSLVRVARQISVSSDFAGCMKSTRLQVDTLLGRFYFQTGFRRKYWSVRKV